jgi:hypothetical protein
MADTLTAKQRSDCMRAVRGQDTTPEILVRQAAHSLGYRYALHRKNLPGKPDLVFVSRQDRLCSRLFLAPAQMPPWKGRPCEQPGLLAHEEGEKQAARQGAPSLASCRRLEGARNLGMLDQRHDASAQAINRFSRLTNSKGSVPSCASTQWLTVLTEHYLKP